MDKMVRDFLKDINEEHECIMFRPVYCASTGKLYLQTEPYIDGDKIVIKRLAEYDVEIQKAYNYIQEFDLSEGESK